MCSCEKKFTIVDGGFHVCINCGVQSSQPIFIKPFTMNHCVSKTPYCRKKRFKKLLYNCWGAKLPQLKDDFVKYIYNNKPKTPVDILELIKLTKKHKRRYDALARLSIDILGHEIEPLTSTQIHCCLGLFENIELLHRKNKTVFPAYSYVLEYCFTEIGRTDLIQYLHLLKCSKRRTIYKNLYFNHRMI